MSEIITAMYETALRKKLRFESPRGDLTLEELWQAPLRPSGNDDFSLDAIAIGFDKKINELSGQSFVSTRKKPEQTKYELKLDITKHIIGVKLDEEKRAENLKALKEEEAILLEALDGKKKADLDGLSSKQIEARLAKIRKEKGE